MKDKRYVRSLETIFGTDSGEAGTKVLTTLDGDRFMRAKQQLIGEGIDADTAESNLRKITGAILAHNNLQVDAEQGEWEQSEKVYSDIMASLPESDERCEHARRCLASIDEKRKSTAGESQQHEP